MTPITTMRKAVEDRNLLGNVLAGDSFKNWRTVLIAVMGEPLTPDELEILSQLTGGRTYEPGHRILELIMVVGRRGGKTRALSVLICYLACLCKYSLVAGETGVALCLAPDQTQAKIILDYCSANIMGSKILSQQLVNVVKQTIELKGNIQIQVKAADYRTLRGPSYITAVLDESAFFYIEDSVNPDSEIVRAVTPALSTTGGMLVLSSSPYMKKGELHDRFARSFGPDGIDPETMAIRAPTRAMNPVLPQRVIDKAVEADSVSAASEYGAEFRPDLSSLVSLAAVQACVERGRRQRLPNNQISYFAFADAAGGMGKDAFALAIGHKDLGRDVVVIDRIAERTPPFSGEDVCKQFSDILKTYRVHAVLSDKFAGSWPVEQFAKFGITVNPDAEPKARLYLDMLALISSGRLDLLDSPKLITQIATLERRTRAGGRDQIDAPQGRPEDLANVVAGCCFIGLTNRAGYSYAAFTENDDVEDAAAYRSARLLEHIMRYG